MPGEHAGPGRAAEPEGGRRYLSCRGLYALTLPDSWRVCEGDPASFVPPEGDLAVTVSAARHRDPAHRSDAREHLDLYLLGRRAVGSIVFEDRCPEIARASYEDDEGIHWLVSMKARGNTITIATINSPLGTQQEARMWAQAVRIIDSVHVAPDA